MGAVIERVFKVGERGSTLGCEVMAGVTTFLTMAYIVAVNPTMLQAAGIPFTYSIANGIGLGFISYVVVMVAQGRAREIHPLMWAVSIVFLITFAAFS